MQECWDKWHSLVATNKQPGFFSKVPVGEVSRTTAELGLSCKWRESHVPLHIIWGAREAVAQLGR